MDCHSRAEGRWRRPWRPPHPGPSGWPAPPRGRTGPARARVPPCELKEILTPLWSEDDVAHNARPLTPPRRRPFTGEAGFLGGRPAVTQGNESIISRGYGGSRHRDGP